MDLKNALSVCLISLFAATLVALIARSLDSQAAQRLEPQLAKIAAELEALRASGGISASSGAAAKEQRLRDGLVVYYFHSNTRCPTCQAIESQARETVEADFAAELESGEMAWKIINYEDPAASDLAAKFEVLMPVVVLARMREGQIEQWNRLDQVWGLVGDKPAFAEFVRKEIGAMLATAGGESASAEPGDAAAAIPLPETDGLPLPVDPQEIPLPQ